MDVNHTKEKAALKPEDKARIDVAKTTYTGAVQTIGSKYGLISQQQTIALGELKTAAAKQDPKGLTEEALTAGIDFAFGKVFAHMGTEMAAGVVTTLQEAWKSGFTAAGTAASTAAKGAVSAQFGLAKEPEVFFDGLAAGYVGTASKQQDAYVDRALPAWGKVDFDVLAAEKLARDAVAARDAITAQIAAGTHLAITKRESFDAWMVAVARKSLGTTGKAADGTEATNMDGAALQPPFSGTQGVLYVYVTLGAAKPGNAKPWRAEAPGMSQALLTAAGVGSATGRNLRDMKLPKQFICSVVGGDQRFQVGVNEAGKVTVSNPTVPWLAMRAGGDGKKQDMALGEKGARLLVEEDLALQTLGGLMA